MEIKLVSARDKEYIEEIIQLEKDVFGEKGAIDLWNLKPYIKYGKVYVLLQENKVIGVCELIKSWNDDKAYLYGFCVRKDCSGKGLGKKFLRYVLDELKNEGLKTVELTVFPENRAAISLYEKFGFIKVDFLEEEYGRGNDRLLYKKELFDFSKNSGNI